MYCYSIVTNVQCVVRELDMWLEISKEHPIFLKTVAKLSGISIPQELIERLNTVQRNFEDLHKAIKEIGGMPGYWDRGYIMYPPAGRVTGYVNLFLRNDQDFIDVLMEIRRYGKENEVWQTLLEHFTQEQQYMYRLFVTLRSQLLMR